MVSETDNLAGKRVVISTDGGRIRTRNYQAEKNVQGTHHKFETPWKEPKLFVITVIDQNGKIERTELPIYDATFGEEGLFRLLGEYLKALNINEVEEVQVIADGALWIWNNAKKMLLELGVAEDKIVETLDYYHAVEHLSKITELLPKTPQGAKQSLFKEFKELLWEGKVKEIIEKIRTRVKRVSKKLKTEIAYFEKNERRLNYPQYRAGKWLCGSGIIESGVRRRDQSAVQVGIVFLEPRKSGWHDISALRLAFREMEICHANYYKFLNEGGQIAIAPCLKGF